MKQNNISLMAMAMLFYCGGYTHSVEANEIQAGNSWHLRLIETNESLPNAGNKLLMLQLLNNGIEIEKISAVSGTLQGNYSERHIKNSGAMLPVGKYKININNSIMAKFNDPELGNGWWIPIIPMFKTKRYGLGIHQDPSWDKVNGESGTHGCIGLDSVEATKKLYNWVKQYNIVLLEVRD